jgi:hypothetical protein
LRRWWRSVLPTETNTYRWSSTQCGTYGRNDVAGYSKTSLLMRTN